MRGRIRQPGRLYQQRGKRAVDLVAGAAILVLTLPVQGVVAILVHRRLGSPVLFCQERPGLRGEPFVLVKFRTMTDDNDADGRPLRDEARLTRFGQFLRSTSLDELPELWNVLRGDMSLVGPRPLLMKYLPLYTSRQAHRHDVRPGMTGWAQVNGRNNTDWHDRLGMDIWYVDNLSFQLDLKVLWMTLLTVLSRSGINQEGHATSSEFTGSNGSFRPQV